MTVDSKLDELLASRSLIVCVGPGGVGKTTFAAAIAVRAAESGRRTVVITIDPARRLADALGLDGLDDALRPVAGLPLRAAMLDTKASYDALIGRITKDPVARQRILDNRVYQSFSRTLARSHAYVAMERLYDVLTATEQDLVVLDTPPTRSALDILDAPQRLVAFLDHRVLAAFVGGGAVGDAPDGDRDRPARRGGSARAWARTKGAEVAVKLFGAMAGEALMGELVGFFDVFIHLRGGFAERASFVVSRLRAASTAFVLVTAPDATQLCDAAYLRDGLLERGTPVDAVVYNRAFHAGLDGAPLEGEADWPDEALSGPLAIDAVRDAARSHRHRLVTENQRSAAAIAAFTADTPGGVARLTLPTLDAEPATLEALSALLRQGR